MVWFKVDDTLAFHEKAVAAGNPAMGLWVRAGSWCAQQLNDGFVPDHMLAALGTKGQAKRLTEVRLWKKETGGYRFHQWGEDGRQPTREEVESKRQEWRDKKRKQRRNPAGQYESSPEESPGDTLRDSSGESRRPVPSRPDPSVPNYTTEIQGVSHVSSGTGDETPLYPDRCHKHGNTYEPDNCGNCADVRKTNQRVASIGPHNPATKPHCGECDETRMLRTRFGAIPCPNCNPAAEAS